MFHTLEAYKVNTRTINALEKKGILSPKDLLCLFPRKYNDFREYTALQDPSIAGRTIACHFHVEDLFMVSSSKIPLTICKGTDLESGNQVTITWMGQKYIKSKYEGFKNKDAVVCGKVDYTSQYGFQFTSPDQFTLEQYFHPGIHPVYTKMKGISEAMHQTLLDTMIADAVDPVEEQVITRAGLPSYQQALQYIHHPKTLEEIELGKKRLAFNDDLYFALTLQKQKEESRKDSPFVANKEDVFQSVKQSFPYELTSDQEACVAKFKENAKQGIRNDLLVQGDVGCGKSIVAFLSMFLMADNGYQSVLMAPTGVLAKQHYLELKSYADRFGFTTDYLGSDVKGKEKKEILNRIASGKTTFLVGTHSVISDSVEFYNLGLVVTDEEHKFGVLQKEALKEKAALGAHQISLSATPIPRSLAGAVMGAGKEVLSIKQMPQGRKPVLTGIQDKDDVIFQFMEKQIRAGRQAYVVCPLIEENEKLSGVKSVEETFKQYTGYFESKGIQVAMLNGKMKKTEIAETIDQFVSGQIQILISTTVVEVGVNVPNANVIVIRNAERYGLASLHQLRGRVGRGSYQSWCILQSEEADNERLLALKETNDGFEIAEKDLELRGSGDLIGIEQSGSNRYTNLIAQKPRFYASVSKYADWMHSIGLGDNLLDYYEKEDSH